MNVMVRKKLVDIINEKYVGEASTMGIGPGVSPPEEIMLYDDSEIINFINPKPDIENGEIVGWKLKTDPALNKLSFSELLVIND